MKRILTVLLFLIAFGISAKAQNPPAYFPGLSGPLYKIKNRLTGYILEIPANPDRDALAREGTICTERSDMGSANQQWYVSGDFSSPSNEIYIINRNSSMYLTRENTSANYIRQYLAPYQGTSGNRVPTASQRWSFSMISDNGKSFYVIRNTALPWALAPASTGEFSKMTLQNLSNYDQLAQWELVDITSATAGGNPALFPGTYKITNVNSGLVLQVFQQSAEPGARIEQGKYIGITSQQWQLIEQYNSNNAIIGFAIVNRLSGLALQVVGQSTADGAAIEQGKFIGINSQLWDVPSEAGAQTFSFRNVNSGYVMQVIGQSKSDGAQMQQGGRVPIGSQLWQLEYVAANRVALAATPSAIENASLTVYPNPASEELNLSPVVGEKFSEASVRNIQGQVVTKISFKTANTLDVSALAPGIYLLTIKNNDTGTVLHRKFVKN